MIITTGGTGLDNIKMPATSQMAFTQPRLMRSFLGNGGAFVLDGELNIFCSQSEQ